ncbi:MAG: hypothetical protein JWM82_2698 [Myxococcales bacterium]|nr:hypothetical protein [Myxococcales bacterium]
MSNEPQPNPFAPPATDIEAGGAAASVNAASLNLATRWQRLGGSLVDTTLNLLAMSPVFGGLSWSSYTKAAMQSKSNPLLLFTMAGWWGAVAGTVLLAINIVNWTLLARRGQTIGKIVAGTRVVLLDGSPAPFKKIVVLRTWVFHLLSYIPGVNRLAPVVGLIDALYIFRADRRCLHDQLAGTKVVRAADPA